MNKKYEGYAESPEIAVVVDELQGLSDNGYSFELANKWGIGSSTYNNDILILLKPKTPEVNREIYIQIGSGITSTFLKYQVDAMISSSIGELKEARYNEALMKIGSKINDKFEKLYNKQKATDTKENTQSSTVANSSTASTTNQRPNNQNNTGFGFIYFLTFIGLILLFFGIRIFIEKKAKLIDQQVLAYTYAQHIGNEQSQNTVNNGFFQSFRRNTQNFNNRYNPFYSNMTFDDDNYSQHERAVWRERRQAREYEYQLAREQRLSRQREYERERRHRREMERLEREERRRRNNYYTSNNYHNSNSNNNHSKSNSSKSNESTNTSKGGGSFGGHGSGTSF